MAKVITLSLVCEVQKNATTPCDMDDIVLHVYKEVALDGESGKILGQEPAKALLSLLSLETKLIPLPATHPCFHGNRMQLGPLLVPHRRVPGQEEEGRYNKLLRYETNGRKVPAVLLEQLCAGRWSVVLQPWINIQLERLQDS